VCVYREMYRSIGVSIVSVIILHVIHWASVLVYSQYCVPTGWQGYIHSFLTTASPVCKLLMEIQYQSIRIYDMTLIGISIVVTHQIEEFAAAYKYRQPLAEVQQPH